jgi:predicted alpha/beta superfamily hydrolase
MRSIYLSPLLLLAALGCSSDQGATTTNVWEPFAGALADTQRRNLTSEITGRTYQISVALPENYATSNKTYPVLYTVDANAQFGTVVETARLSHLPPWNLVPELIVVGIGYPVGRFTNARAPRGFDLTPTEDLDLRPDGGGGGAPGFLEFIRRELIPLIELEFRADSADRALYGHSIGGLFALYALLEGEGTFQSVIAGSPAIGWNHRVIFRMESAYAESHDSLPAQLFISCGFLEDIPGYGQSVSNIKELVTILESRNYKELQIETAYFEDENHISVIPATISRGLRAIYAGHIAAGSE